MGGGGPQSCEQDTATNRGWWLSALVRLAGVVCLGESTISAADVTHRNGFGLYKALG